MDLKQWLGLAGLGAFAMAISLLVNEPKDLSKVEGARVPTDAATLEAEAAERVKAPEVLEPIAAPVAPAPAEEEAQPEQPPVAERAAPPLEGEAAAASETAKPAPAPVATSDTEPETASSKPAATPRASGGQGPSIKGVVKWEGKPPKNAKIAMTSDPVCEQLCAGEEKRKETTVVNENGTLKNVVVYVSEGLPKKEWPVRQETLVLDQVGCTYVPHVFAIQIGQKYEIRNSDPTTHNVHFKSKLNGDWNKTQSEKGNVDPDGAPKRPEVGTAMFKCDIHTWMEARAAIFDHPFFAVTGDDGSFEISGLPAGTYTITAWHEKEKAQEQKVTVSDGGTAEVTFTFKK